MLNISFYITLLYKTALVRLRTGQLNLPAAGLLLILNLVLALPTQANDKVIRFSVSAFPPFTIVKDKHVSGIDIDILQQLAKTIGHEILLIQCPWKRCLKLMEQGQIDMMATALYTQERAQYMEYIRPEYVRTAIAFYSAIKNKIQINQYDDLLSLTVGRELGSANFEPFNSDIRIIKKDFMEQTQLLHLLMAERIDVVVGGRVSMNYMIEQNDYGNNIIQQPYLHMGAKAYFTVSKKSKLMQFINPLTREMQTLQDNGFLNTVIDKVSSGEDFNRQAF